MEFSVLNRGGQHYVPVLSGGTTQLTKCYYVKLWTFNNLVFFILTNKITPTNPHTSPPDPNDENSSIPDQSTRNSNSTKEDRSSLETRMKPTGMIKIDAEEFLKKINKLILGGVIEDELIKYD